MDLKPYIEVEHSTSSLALACFMASTTKSFTVVEGRIAGLFVQSVIFGLYLVTFFHTLRSLLHNGSRWKRTSEINYPMLIVALFMFVNVTVGIALGFNLVWRAFVLEPDRTEVVLEDITNWTFVVKSVTLLFQTIIGDAMLIYRCWVVYHRSWKVIAVSFVLWIGGTTCSIFLTYYQATLSTSGLISASKLRPFGIAFWALTVTVNILTTTLLVWPIWKAARRHDEYAYHTATSGKYTNTMRDIMFVIIESGFMYTVAAFITFVTYTTKHNSLYIASDAEVDIAGIAFNLIIIRTDKARRERPIPPIGTTIPFRARPADTTVADGNIHIMLSDASTTRNGNPESTASESEATADAKRMDDV